MRRRLVLAIVAVVDGVALLLFDALWWRGPLHEELAWLNDWYHLFPYLPTALALPLVAGYLAGLSGATLALYLLASLAIATWINDVAWYPLLGCPEQTMGYCFKLSWENWNRLHVGFTPYVPWWLFSLSNIARPLLGAALLQRICTAPRSRVE